MRTVTLSFLMCALIGCGKNEQYELSVGEVGKLYRLNKTTGEVSLVQGYTITKLREPKSGEESDLSEKKLSEATTWPELTLPLSLSDNIMLTLKTIWREGNLHYQLSASPYEPKLKEARQSYLATGKGFTLQLMDSVGFVLLQIPVSLSQMQAVVDAKGKRTHMTGNDKIPCTSETYLALSYWNSSWNF